MLMKIVYVQNIHRMRDRKMNEKQEDYLLKRLAQALAMNNPRRFDEIQNKIEYEFKELGECNE